METHRIGLGFVNVEAHMIVLITIKLMMPCAGGAGIRHGQDGPVLHFVQVGCHGVGRAAGKDNLTRRPRIGGAHAPDDQGMIAVMLARGRTIEIDAEGIGADQADGERCAGRDAKALSGQSMKGANLTR